MDWTVRRERFRALLNGVHCIHPASVHDPVSVRIAEELGFEMGMFAGSVASLTVLGAPDLILLTLSEFADQAHRINRAGNLPLLVDADHGYGNALNVMRTVQELETAGVAGLSIEDTDLPQPFGDGRPRLLPVGEGVGKMRAALAGRQDPRLCIAGRTSALRIAGLEDAIIRARAYEEVGVDAVFLVGIGTRAEIDALSSAVSVPIILGSLPEEARDADYLAARNVRIALTGHQPFRAAVEAVRAALKALRDGGGLPPLASAELMARVTRAGDHDRWTKEFLNGA